MNLPDISVVVFSSSNPDGCVRLLSSLETVRRDNLEMEVVLVYTGLNQKVEQLLHEQVHGFELKLIPAPETSNRAAGRNRGVDHATNDIILFLDDTLECSPELVIRHLEKYSEKNTSAVMGEQFLPPFVKKSRWFRFLDSDQRSIRRWARGGSSKTPPLRYVSTSNFSIRKAVFAFCGGYDESIANHEAENIDLAHRLTASGKQGVVYNPEAIAFSQHAPLREALKARYEFGGEGIPKLLEAYPDIYGKLPSRFLKIDGFQPVNTSYRILAGALFTKPFLIVARAVRLVGPERLAFWMIRYMLQYYSVWGLKHALRKEYKI